MTQGTAKLLTVIVNDTAYLVEVGDLMTWPTTVKVNGRAYRVSIDPARGASPEPEAPASSARRPAVVSVAPPSAPDAASGQPGFQVRAPMPGNILGIAVRAGDRVCIGQELCSLEAMKMRNAIRSVREGVIARVEVTEGQTVAYGDVLFILE